MVCLKGRHPDLVSFDIVASIFEVRGTASQYVSTPTRIHKMWMGEDTTKKQSATKMGKNNR
jgi:hypothetical protein